MVGAKVHHWAGCSADLTAERKAGKTQMASVRAEMRAPKRVGQRAGCSAATMADTRVGMIWMA